LIAPRRCHESPGCAVAGCHDIDFTFEWLTVRVYHASSSGSLSYFARLNPDHGFWHWTVSDDGSQVVGASSDHNFGYGPGAWRRA
jgi:hypothetical protein